MGRTGVDARSGCASHRRSSSFARRRQSRRRLGRTGADRFPDRRHRIDDFDGLPHIRPAHKRRDETSQLRPAATR
ncbi:hypothetical protein [Lysobacter gummosus]|uniref:hypothetical protein n=1 Tax=Lysobacter gummosus TaxID=262324 RepID=UPI0036379363